MLFQVDVAIRQQEPPRWHGFLHIGAFGAIEVIVLGDKPGMADMVTELHTVCVDDIQVGEIRYAREALQKHLSEVQEAEQSVYRLQSEPRGRLRISAPESLAMSLLPEVLPHFQQAFPKLELDIRITGRFVDLVEEGIDVALRVGTLDDSSLIARKLMPCRFHICASPDYLNRHGRPKHPNELAKHNCLIYSQGQNPEIWFFRDGQGKRLNVKVTGALHSDTGSLLMNAALNNAGIIIAPTFMVRSLLEQDRLETVLDDYMPSETGLYAVYPYSRLVSKKVRVFVDYLAETRST